MPISGTLEPCCIDNTVDPDCVCMALRYPLVKILKFVLFSAW